MGNTRAQNQDQLFLKGTRWIASGCTILVREAVVNAEIRMMARLNAEKRKFLTSAGMRVSVLSGLTVSGWKEIPQTPSLLNVRMWYV
jgi:hypothetical protein